VVIEKLPFEVPTELRRRREARIRLAGQDAFERFTLGKMLLNLKQMTGRLIRTEEDRGIAVIVEGRTDRRYFARLGEALPAGCSVARASRSQLAALLAEVGIEGAAPGAAGRGR
jgi:ATP-dependent DNA helicase DinG